MVEIKREYVIPLRRGFQNTPRYKRTHKAVRVLKAFLIKNMKSENVKIGPKLNDFMWRHGIKNPPGKVEVIVTKNDEGLVKAELKGFDYVDFKQLEEQEEPKNLKEKLQSKVADTKGTARTPEGDKIEVKEKKEKVAEEKKEEKTKDVKEEKKEEKVEKKDVEEKPAKEKPIEASKEE